ncbi:MAG: hypothetical protein WCS09_14705 [Pseudomonadota bacterium]
MPCAAGCGRAWCATAPASPAEIRRYVLNEQAKFAKVVKQVGLDPTD